MSYQKVFTRFFATGVILLLCLYNSTSKAQYYNLMWEAGFKVGGANYLGEIGGTYEPQAFLADMKIQKTRPGLGIYGRRVLTNYFSVYASLQYSLIAAADSLSLQPSRFSRNLSFRNQIKELCMRGELYLINLNDIGRTGRYILGLRAYGLTGVTLFHHNPQTNYQGTWYDLRPLKTEGRSYSAFQVGIPFGFGVTVTFLKRHRFGVEATWNYTFTDYLDDVSSYYLSPSAHENEMSRILADRSPEVSPDDPKFVGITSYAYAADFNERVIRGNPESLDSFVTLFLTYGYAFKGGKENFSRKRYDWVGVKPRRYNSKAKF